MRIELSSGTSFVILLLLYFCLMAINQYADGLQKSRYYGMTSLKVFATTRTLSDRVATPRMIGENTPISRMLSERLAAAVVSI